MSKSYEVPISVTSQIFWPPKANKDNPTQDPNMMLQWTEQGAAEGVSIKLEYMGRVLGYLCLTLAAQL